MTIDVCYTYGCDNYIILNSLTLQVMFLYTLE